MTETIFPERRTRSQLTLPDNILQIPSRSPLKDARTALRNHATNQTDDPCSPTNSKRSDETDDELLLSPGKQRATMQTPGTSRSKRSVSPPMHEYAMGSGSVEGRELKRVKRDSDAPEGMDGSETMKPENPLLKRLTPGHVRNHSEPNIPPTTRRSGRKRYAPDSEKPVSTVSVSPPPSTFSPRITSPKGGRAQSVPLFPSSRDVPHIDFRNPPRSPKRSRSPSRSPDKSGESKRRLFTPFNITKTLSTVQDVPEPSTKMDLDDEPTSVCEEVEMEIPHPPSTSTEPLESININEPTIMLSGPSDSTTSIQPEIPATPSSRSLDNLIPLSPLTPLPETPLPPRVMTVGSDSRYTGGLGWGLPSTENIPKPLPAPALIPPVTLTSRLPRPSMAPPPVPPPKTSKVGSLAPPKLLIAPKKPGPSAQSMVVSSSKNIPKKVDAFAVLMKGNREAKARQETDKSQQEMKSVLSIEKGTGVLAGPSSQPKPKMKDKMRPKTKVKAEKTPQFAPLSDEDGDEEVVEDEEHTDPSIHSALEAEAATSQQNEQPGLFSNGIEMKIEHFTTVGNEMKGDDPITSPVFQEALEHEAVAIPTTCMESTVVSPTTSENPEFHPPIEHINDVEPPPPPSATIDLEESKESEVVHNETLPVEDLALTKLPVAKKRRPVSVLPASRVTRSVSNSRKKVDGVPSSITGPSLKKPTKAPGFAATKRTTSRTINKPTESGKAAQASTDKQEQQRPKVPGSPMKISSPAKSAALISPKKTPRPFSFSLRPVSTPSPTKSTRSSSLFADKSSNFPTARSFSMAPSQVSLGASSSLSTLSNALERLRMPAPSRPSTSMGFNRDTPSELDSAPSQSQDDAGVGRTSIGLGRPEGLKRASTLDASAFKAPTATASNATASTSKSASSNGKNLIQRPLTMFMSNKDATGKSGAGVGRGMGRTSMFPFGVGGGARRTVSKKPPLPVVVGSPVKGGGAPTLEDEESAEETCMQIGENSEDVGMSSVSHDTSTLTLQDISTTEGNKEKGKEKEKDYGSRRVSMMSHALSQSLSAIPPRGLMGPPATPPGAGRSPKRSTSSSYPSTSAGGSSPSQSGGAVGTRSSARLAKTAPANMKIRGGTDGHVASRRKGATEPVGPPDSAAAEARKVLKDCIIFVDVKTDDGDEAGSLFVEMLEGVGARVLTRVGQTCTHIVYKNGLTSTLTRYRLLRDPKPFVVGIAWVVECIEKMKRVDETEFLIDIEGTNVAGIIKRRRSILPKSFTFEDEVDTGAKADKEEGDRSMDGSTSSVMGDDDLAPLERARRRKSIMIGPR